MVDWWIWGVEFLVLVVLLLLIPVVWLLVRRRWIAGRGRAFQCSLRRADGLVWEGDAVQVIARTTEGDLGILTHHEPFFGILVPSAAPVASSSS